MKNERYLIGENIKLKKENEQLKAVKNLYEARIIKLEDRIEYLENKLWAYRNYP